MKHTLTTGILALILACPSIVSAQGAEEVETPTTFAEASADIDQRLQSSLAELTSLREQLVAEKKPLSARLNELQLELTEARAEYQKTTRLLDTRTLDLSNLQSEIKKREDQATYLTGLLSEYAREFSTRLHRAETDRYESLLEEADLAIQNSSLSGAEVDAAQLALVRASLDRLEEVLGGSRFEGTAIDESGEVHRGTFALVGPIAYFSSNSGEVIGVAEQRLNSIEPAAIPFADPVNAEAARSFIQTGRGEVPIDPTLGKAHKIAATQETVLGEIRKGGVVMYPIFGMASLALLLAAFKWLSMLLLRKPSKRKIGALLDAVSEGNEELAVAKARAIRGPVGRMLTAGAEHLREPRELIEEVMYEVVLTTRLRLQGFLPFIAICAASAPLLGLLGTVTGIIKTFKMITVFGSGDVKTLSDGISEALITTKFGLVVAIPSLLLHAFLSRKARGVIGHMETSAVSLLNQISKTPMVRPTTVVPMRAAAAPEATAAPDPNMVRDQVNAILSDMLAPIVQEEGPVSSSASQQTN